MIDFFRTNKEIKPLAYASYWWTVFLLAAAALSDSVYLSISHFRVYTDIDYQSFCAISRSLNCDTVSQSSFSILLGVPVPVWGIMGYAFFMICVMLARRGDARPCRIWTWMFVFAAAFSLYSIVLAFISSYYIHSYCIMCIASYAINLLLLFYTWLIRKRFQAGSIRHALGEDLCWLWAHRTISGVAFGLFFIAVVWVLSAFPAYWNLALPQVSANTPIGITTDGHPWIGAENPRLVIVEFADYQCFQCKKMHFFLRRLIAQHPDKIRLVHRHFPMDHRINPIVREPFHVGSGAMALTAIAAMAQQRFWQMNDVLYATDLKKGVINIRQIAKQAMVDYDALKQSMMDKRNINKLIGDIRRGQQLGVNGTPAFLIGKKLYLGNIPADVIENALH